MDRIKALAFWNEVYGLFPTQDILDWMNLIAENKVDWFRNGGLALIAVTTHSNNSRGLFSNAKCEANRAVLDTIVQKYNLSLQA